MKNIVNLHIIVPFFTKLLQVIIFILIVSNCANQENATVESGKLESIRKYIDQRIRATNTPSISIALAKDDGILWEESFGWADREKRIKATPHTIYSLASVSKPLTATGMMVLVERGLIDLNEPAGSYLGETTLKAFAGSVSDATVSRLLHHTAGLPTIWNFYFDGSRYSRPTIAESISKFGIITSAPGTVYEYSNLGYGIAEHIIENVANMSFADFMKSEVFEPLGLFETFVLIEKSQYDIIAQRYLENKNVSPFYETMSRGGGGICASVHDLVRFGMFHLKNRIQNQKAIISCSSIEYMQTNVDPQVPESPYKIGWVAKEIKGYRVVTHGGGMPGVSSVLMLIPSANMVIAILSNGTYIDLSELATKIMQEFLPSTDSKNPNPVAASSTEDRYPTLEQFNGQWRGAIYHGGDSLNILLDIDDAEGVKLIVADQKTELIPIEPFRLKYGRLTGSFDFVIPTMEASVARHRVEMSLNINKNLLYGYAAAVSYRVEVYFLPYFVKLERM